MSAAFFKFLIIMKKILNLLLFLPFVMHGIYAQSLSPKWESCFGGTKWDEATGIIYADSSYWVVGSTESSNGDISYNHGNKDIWLLNIDVNGNLLKEKTFGGSKYEGGFSKILKLNDTIFYIASGTNSSDGDIDNNPWPRYANLWILKINNKGNILWNRVCGGSGIDEIRDATVTNDGGILALGISLSDDGDITDHHGFWDLWLIKLDGSGQKQWTLSLGGRGLEEGGSVIQTSDGGYMVVGTTTGTGGGNFDTTVNYHGPGHRWADAWLVKLDSTGNIEWQQCYGGSWSDGAYNILELSDGYVILGFTESNDGDVSGLHGHAGPNSKYGGDIWVFKIDKTGKLLWQRCLGGSYDDFARNIFTTPATSSPPPTEGL